MVDNNQFNKMIENITQMCLNSDKNNNQNNNVKNYYYFKNNLLNSNVWVLNNDRNKNSNNNSTNHMDSDIDTKMNDNDTKMYDNNVTTKTSAKRYPPRPSFQLQATESGYAIIENRIGLAIIKIPAIKFKFCITLNLKKANK